MFLQGDFALTLYVILAPGPFVLQLRARVYTLRNWFQIGVSSVELVRMPEDHALWDQGLPFEVWFF